MSENDHQVPPQEKRVSLPPTARTEAWFIQSYRNLDFLNVILRATQQAFESTFPPAKPRESSPPCAWSTEITQLEDVLRDPPSDNNVGPRKGFEFRTDIKDALEEVYRRIREDSPVDERASYTLHELIKQWIHAGARLRHCKQTLQKQAEAESAAAKKRFFLWIRNLFRRSTPTTPPSTSRLNRFNLLIQLVEKKLGPKDPSIWCFHLTEPWCPTVAALESLMKVDAKFFQSEVSSLQQEDCLWWLIRVCGAPLRLKLDADTKDPRGPDAFKKWREKLEQSAKDLLATPPVIEEKPSSDTALIYWKKEVSKEATSIEVLAKPLVPRGRHRSSVLVRGVIKVPSVQALVKWMRGGSSLLAKAVLAVDDSISSPTFMPMLLKPYSLTQRIDALKAIARLLSAIQMQKSAFQNPPTPEEQAALDCQTIGWLDGISVEPCVDAPPRTIPCRIDELPQPVSTFPLSMLIYGEKQGEPLVVVPVGAPAEPATCPQTIFEAIEKLDWDLWGIEAAKKVFDKSHSPRLDEILTNVSHKTWEPLKKKLLAASKDDAGVMAEGVRYAVLARLTLEAMPAGSPTDDRDGNGMVNAVINDTRDLQTALLRQLHEIDATVLGGLNPPRTLDGDVNVFLWRAKGFHGDTLWTEATWERSEKAFGTQINETTVDGNKIKLTFSASSQASDADLRLLSLPYVTICPTDSSGTKFAGPLSTFGEELLRSLKPHNEGLDISGAIAEALSRLQKDFSSDLHRDAFNALVNAATASKPIPHAVEWLKLLTEDRQNRFSCFPPVNLVNALDDAAGFAIGPVSFEDSLVEDSLLFETRADVRPGKTLGVRYALDKKRSKRVLSRLAPVEGSPEHMAERLEDMAAGVQETCVGLTPLKPAAKALRHAVDLVRTFPKERERTSKHLTKTVHDALDELVKLAAPMLTDDRQVDTAKLDGTRPDDSLAEVFEILSQIARHHQINVVPSRWSPASGAPVAEFQSAHEFLASFHPTIPPGQVIVDTFGLTGEHPRKGEFRQSVGPAPAGYKRLRDLARAVSGDGPLLQDLHERLDQFPRRVLEDKSRLAIPSLYESVWNVIVDQPDAVGDLESWKAAIAEFIRKPFDMVMVAPSKVGDYPSSWVVGPDGKTPSGKHITRIIRPGVRTLENKLVWPAIVETE